MSDLKPLVKYSRYNNSIIFPARIALGLLPDFAGAIKVWRERRKDNSVTLDFAAVIQAYANGMLGIIAIVNRLQSEGTTVHIVLPEDVKARNFFSSTGWSHLLSPALDGRYRKNNQHFVEHFYSFEEIPGIINNFMEIIMGNIQLPRDVLAALEWSITEICDNVVNHAESGTGGYLQVIAYPQNDLVAFTVADAGKGILESLKEGIPVLDNDLHAIQEAIKAGITRNKSAGQGNGLAGTSRIATMTGGSLDILTGTGRLLLQKDKQTPILHSVTQHFPGTCVSGQIVMSHEFSVVEALSFGPIGYTPYTIVDSRYEKEDTDAFYVKINQQVEGAGTRAAGRELRNKVLNLNNSKPAYPIYIDWIDVNVIASSFADEFLGKLFVETGIDKFEGLIRNINMEEVVEHIISKAISERSMTGN